jgi:hypothetical protein
MHEAKKRGVPSCMGVNRRERCVQSHIDEKKRQVLAVALGHA